MDCIHRTRKLHNLGKTKIPVYRCEHFKSQCVLTTGEKTLIGNQSIKVCQGCPANPRRNILPKVPHIPQIPINPRKSFDRVIIINLKRRKDRLDAIKKQIDKCQWPFDAWPTVMSGIDGQKVMAPEGYKEGRNVWACLQSHRMAIQDCINNDFNSVLILEDDAVFCDNFGERALKFMTDIPQDWQFAFLGGHHYQSQPILVKPGVVRPLHMDRMHAYAARGSGLMDLYQFWNKWHDGHCDHAISKWICERKTYCMQPWGVGQGGGPSDVQRQHGNGPQTIKGEEWWIAAEPQPPKPVVFTAPIPKPGKLPSGVGTEVSLILKSIGIQTQGCGGCEDMVKKMNDWGVEGCRIPENRETILRRLRQKSSEVNWMQKINLAKNAVLTGLAAEVNWLDPASGILDKAIEIVRVREHKPILSLCMPTRGRPELVKKGLDSFFDTTRGHWVECVVASHPDESVDLLKKMESDQETYPGLKFIVVDEMDNAIQATNKASELTTGKFLLIGHDDLVFTDGWLDKAIEAWESIGKPENILIGLHDDDARYLANPCELFPHGMASRSFLIDECGGVLAVPHYKSWFNYDEIFQRALKANCTHRCLESKIIHNQAARGRMPMDETAISGSLKHAGDEEMFRRRKIMGFPNDFDSVLKVAR